VPVVTLVTPADVSTINPGDTFQVVASVSDGAATITDVQLVWTSPNGSDTLEMDDLGNGQAGIELDLDPSAQPGPRTVTIIATDSNGQQGQAVETLQVQ
jgi:hypothetical protein